MGAPFRKILISSLSTFLLLSPAFAAGVGESNPSNEQLLKQISKGFSSVAKKATPAVVYIESQTVEKPAQTSSPFKSKKGTHENPFDYFNDEFFNRFFGFPHGQSQEKPSKAETVRGSGFIVSPDGYIVTNNHVVENATRVNVLLNNGKKAVATVVGTDPKTDLAVIKINEKNLPFLNFADSDKLEVGDWAIAIGNPFGLQATVTVGVVSAKGRSQLHIADFEDFIQTDAAINPGNSGGPLLDVNGEVIGVNTAIVSGSGGYMGIGFAIPSNMAKNIIDQLIKNGQVVRGFLGVTLQPVDADLANFYKLDTTHGALVTDVIKGSPADHAGLKQEDVILSYNGNKVDNLSAFRNQVSLMSPGAKLKLKVNREGKVIDLLVTVSSVPEEAITAPNSPFQKLGIKVQNLTGDLATQLGYGDEKGVVITYVEPNGPAAEAGLRSGSLIVAVNRRKISNIDEFNMALKDAREGRILLMVRQGEAIRFVAILLD